MSQVLNQIHDLVSQHVVSIIWFDGSTTDPSDERAICISGSIVSIASRVFLLTAGHVIKDLDQVLTQRKLIHCDLYGNWRSTNTETGKIAFDYERTKRWYLYDESEGFDYGLIGLTPYYAEHLSAIGMRPLSEPQWLDPPSVLRNHILVGMPSEFVKVNQANRRSGFSGAVTVTNTLLPVEPVVDPPPELVKPHKRLYAKLVAPASAPPGEFCIKSIEGMSGGAVFAAGLSALGQPGYWLLGVQSGWHRPSRVIAACPVDEVFRLMRERYRDVDVR